MALMFTATASIKKAVTLLNKLDAAKFPLLLSRILQKLHLKDERTFSDEEEEKLQVALDLNSQDLDLVIEACEFFLHQAAYHTAKPAVLSQQLSQLELEDDKVQAVVEAWTSAARGVVEKLRTRTLAPKQLQDVNWRLNLQMAQSNTTKLKEPNAMFELGVDNEATEEKEKIKIEFSREELYKFYNQVTHIFPLISMQVMGIALLETIQGQIDALS